MDMRHVTQLDEVGPRSSSASTTTCSAGVAGFMLTAPTAAVADALQHGQRPAAGGR